MTIAVINFPDVQHDTTPSFRSMMSSIVSLGTVCLGLTVEIFMCEEQQRSSKMCCSIKS